MQGEDGLGESSWICYSDFRELITHLGNPLFCIDLPRIWIQIVISKIQERQWVCVLDLAHDKIFAFLSQPDSLGNFSP